MRTTSAAGGLLSTGKTSTATKTTYNQPPVRLYLTGEVISKKTNLRTPILSVSYDSRFRRNKLPASLSCRRVIETKSGQNRTFDPGGSQGHLRADPFLGTWRALLCGEAMRFGAAGDDLQRFWRIDDSRFQNVQEKGTNCLCHTYCSQSFFLRYGSFKNSCRRGWLEVIGCQERSVVGERHGASSLTARNSAERLVASVIWS